MTLDRNAPTAMRRRVRDLFPEGLALPEEVWRARHRVMVRILAAHAVGLALFAVVRGFDLAHGLLEASPLAAAAAVGASTRLSRSARMLATTAGLVTASAIMVHLSGGTIEAHFHFFVVLGIISLYQSWRPFLLALGYVVLHHGVMGVLDAPSVYNHAAAWNNPWKWAGIHGAFVLAASAAQLGTWRFSEHARRHAELMLASAGQGMVGVGADGRIIFLNRGAADALGIDRDAAIGEPVGRILQLSVPSGNDADPIGSTVGTGASHAVSDAWLGAGEHRFPVELLTTPIVLRGEVIGAMLTFMDVTERRRAQDELHQTLSLLSATLESTADGLLVVDAQGRISSFNQKFVEMWRIPQEVVESGDDERAIASVLDQLRDPDAFVAKVRELYAEPDAHSQDMLEFKDGRVFERYSQPQRVNGVSVGRVWSFRDVTERKRLDEMKDGFLSAVSHELRTPLTSVVGFAATLRAHDAEFDPRQRRDLLERLDSNAQKLQRLLTDILDLDRLGRDILEPRRAPTDLARTIRALVEEVSASGERVVTVEVADGTFMLDHAKVERIIENLLTNAVRHTPSGSRVWVRSWVEDDGITIAVEDDGPGVPADVRATIFEPFRQGPVVRAHAPGVGVGLSLVARFADLHGGRAWVEERPGGGASFRVHLPAARAPAERAESKAG